MRARTHTHARPNIPPPSPIDLIERLRRFLLSLAAFLTRRLCATVNGVTYIHMSQQLPRQSRDTYSNLISHWPYNRGRWR